MKGDYEILKNKYGLDISWSLFITLFVFYISINVYWFIHDRPFDFRLTLIPVILIMINFRIMDKLKKK